MSLTPLWISLQTALCATAITCVLGVLTARWRLRSRGRIGPAVDAALLFPLALPPSVLGLVLLLVFGRSSPLGRALSDAGMTIIFSWPATVLAAFVVSFPIMYQTACGAFRQVNSELVDAARVFGRSEWRNFVRVVIPLAWPGLTAGTILSFLRALGEFGATLMIAGNIPGRTQTAPVAVFFAVEGGDFNEAVLLASILAAIALSAILVLHWIQQRIHPGN